VARRNGDPNGDVAVPVVVIREHRIDPLAHEEGRLPVGQFFAGSGQAGTNPPQALQVVLAGAP